MNQKIIEVAWQIREMREIMKKMPGEIAEKAGIPIEEYKKYESGELDIPISAIYSAASALEVDPTVLLTGETPRMKQHTITRKGKGISIERCKEYRFSALAHNFINRIMDPMIVELLTKDTPPELVPHKGQEFNYVLKGEVIVLYGDHRFQLSQGDSIYFDPKVPHGQMTEKGYAKFLTVIMD